jgi:predicted methyltransferase
MDGLLIIDKPPGPTSHDVVARVRRALGERRIGHTGTLDPAATGVLPLVLGRATRLARFLSASDKSYEAVVRLGVATDTQDAEGAASGPRYEGPLPSHAMIDRALDSFRGTFLQQPPAFSAKKIDGERSYRTARRARQSASARSADPALSALPALPAFPALPAPVYAQSGPVTPKVRLFSALDLGLLEAPDRDAWQRPELIMDELRIAEGSIVADLGAGGGWFTVKLARRVGPNGLVYAEDIQPQMIEAIQRRTQRERLKNVRTILGTPSDPRLPRRLDAVLIVDAYHEMEHPVVLLANVEQALGPQGRLGVVGFLPGGGGPGPAPDERVDPDIVVKAATAAGLKLEARQAVPPFQFLLVFRRGTNDSGAF